MVSGKAAKSKKCGPGGSGSGDARFDKEFNREIDSSWKGCQIQRNMVLEGLGQEIIYFIKH